METHNAPCLNRTCKETAQFKKGAIKWIMTCPNCGSQFYQSKKAKEDVEKYLEKFKLTDDKPVIAEPNKASETNGDKQIDDSKEKPKTKRLFSRKWRKGERA